jgi:membrane protein
MSFRSSRPVVLARAMVAEVTQNHLTFMAGSLAFYAFLSLIPLFLLSFIAASVVGGEAFADQITALFNSTLTGSARELLAEALTDSSGQTGASVLGLATLLWSALKLFRGLDIAFDAVYGVRDVKSLPKQLRDALVVLAGVALGVVAVVLTGGVLAFVPDLPIPLLGRLSPLYLVVGLTFVFFPVYYFVPDVDVSATEVLPGTVLSAIGWALTQFAFQIYVSYAGQYTAYGIVGGVLLVLIWLYYSCLVLLFGAVTNVVLAGRSSYLDEGNTVDGPSLFDVEESDRWRW